MTRLIDADELREKWIWGNTDRTKKVECIELVDLDNAPTVDAVEVVRCKDCMCFICGIKLPFNAEGMCDCTGGYVGYDDYCSFGERKEDDR